MANQKYPVAYTIRISCLYKNLNAMIRLLVKYHQYSTEGFNVINVEKVIDGMSSFKCLLR